ncbi:PTS dihydroxyacetone transporter [Listeria monocytogenes]|nr:PTS dihydroxyacetone transporter [Listeria monocytogenes]
MTFAKKFISLVNFFICFCEFSLSSEFHRLNNATSCGANRTNYLK